MKKTITFIVAVAICMFLCACGDQNKKSDQETERMMLEMKINVNEAAFYLIDANEEVIKSLYAIEEGDKQKSVDCFQKALELVKAARERVDASISSPNFISKKLEELEENFEETLTILPSFTELPEEEADEAYNLISIGTSKHLLLTKALSAFTFLYEIRTFDKLPDNEAQANLKDSWWRFGFGGYIQCPNTIDKQELYLLWARQHFEKLDEERFLTELQALRESDDLSSTECNRRWTELIENFIMKAEEGAHNLGRPLPIL